LAVNNELQVSIILVYQGCRIVFRFGKMIAACNIKYIISSNLEIIIIIIKNINAYTTTTSSAFTV